MRGGVSDSFYVVSDNFSSSPHARGCFWASWWRTMTTRVFPACAGVFPGRPERVISPSGLPRMRGGVSEEKENKNVFAQSSPHARGCFQGDLECPSLPLVFPACAGVFLSTDGGAAIRLRLPRMRGGVSRPKASQESGKRSSPHARGCFLTVAGRVVEIKVFPACAGVFLNRVLSNQS